VKWGAGSRAGATGVLPERLEHGIGEDMDWRNRMYKKNVILLFKTHELAPIPDPRVKA
jgi:hypothetical protein